MLMMMKRKFV